MSMASHGKDPFDAPHREWWDPKGSFISLHMINPLRFQYFYEKIGDLKNKTVLDIGCGGGLLSEEFAKKGGRVTGIDLSENAIRAAREHAEGAGLEIEYLLASPSDLVREGKGPYDVVVCAEILEHVDDLEGFVRDAASLLKDGGYFFFTTVNRTWLSRVLVIYLAEHILRLIPKGAHRYDMFIRPSTLVKVLKKNRIHVKELKGMVFDPLKLTFRLSESTAVNYLGYGIKE